MRPISQHAMDQMISTGVIAPRRRRTGLRILVVVALTGAILLALATPLVAVGLG